MSSGFTLIELIVVIAIIGILSIFALPAYQDYTKRTYVTEGIALSSIVKNAMVEHFSITGEWANSNIEVNLPLGSDITGQAISAIWISAPSTTENILSDKPFVVIYFNQKVIDHPTLTPTTQPDWDDLLLANNILILSIIKNDENISHSIRWGCYISTLKEQWLPATCRSQISQQIDTNTYRKAT